MPPGGTSRPPLSPTLSPADAIAALKPSAVAGNSISMMNLGNMLGPNDAGVHVDLAESFRWKKLAVDTPGVPKEAFYNLSLCYEKGLGVPVSATEAAKLMLRGAEAGHLAAQFCMGLRYQTGDGVECNPASAYTWFRTAANAGEPRAGVNAGAAVFFGEGTKRDACAGVDFWTHSAAAGDSNARYNLALAYLTGEGVGGKPDLITAITLLKKAAAGGQLQALEWVAGLQKVLSKNAARGVGL